jgi:hypothetical protein
MSTPADSSPITIAQKVRSYGLVWVVGVVIALTLGVVDVADPMVEMLGGIVLTCLLMPFIVLGPEVRRAKREHRESGEEERRDAAVKELVAEWERVGFRPRPGESVKSIGRRWAAQGGKLPKG